MVNYDGVNRTYNAANQMTNDGTNTLTYDNNGNLRTVGSDTYTWDRANRLTDVGNHSYVYDGLGNRVQQTVNTVVTDYLNDVQPGLTKLLAQSTGANTEHFVHGVRGIHAVDDGIAWNFYAQDGLGSVRAIVEDSAVVQTSMSFDPYGNPMASYGAGFGFTGDQTDANGSVFLQARYYEPQLGIFSALDPWGGTQDRAMSLNRYSWVEGNPIRYTDASGQLPCDTSSGGAGSRCLTRIEDRLLAIRDAAWTFGTVAPQSGGTIARNMLTHYLRGNGADRTIHKDYIGEEYLNLAKTGLLQSFQATNFYRNMCTTGCFEATSNINLGTLNDVRGERNVDRTGQWWAQAINWIRDQTGWSALNQVSNKLSENPYYSAFGGLTVTPIKNDVTVNPDSSSSRATVTLNSLVEYYDYYDWCFGGNTCLASGTHPFDLRVGHFLALEEAGMAHPFNVYGYVEISMTFEVMATGVVPSITTPPESMNVTYRNRRRSYVESNAGVSLPIVPQRTTPIGGQTPNFVDNWPDQATAQSQFQDPLFPDESAEWDANGNFL